MLAAGRHVEGVERLMGAAEIHDCGNYHADQSHRRWNPEPNFLLAAYPSGPANRGHRGKESELYQWFDTRSRRHSGTPSGGQRTDVQNNPTDHGTEGAQFHHHSGFTPEFHFQFKTDESRSRHYPWPELSAVFVAECGGWGRDMRLACHLIPSASFFLNLSLVN